MLTQLFSFALSWLAGPTVNKVLSHLETKADSQTERERIRTQATIEQIRAGTEEVRIMAQYNTAKLNHWPYWVFVALFVVPLGIWWAAVLLDSTFLFGWGVASLPQPYIREWAGDMIQWLFYVGSGAMALRVALNR